MRPTAFALVVCIGLVAGCEKTARLYDLDTGDVYQSVVTVHGTGHGEIMVVTDDGDILKGEFSLMRNDVISSSSARVSGSIGGQFGWATAQGFTVTNSRAVLGSAVVAGKIDGKKESH